MKKKVLSEIAIHTGQVIMPEGWEINFKKIASDIITANIHDENIQFSKDLDRLDKYIQETFRLRNERFLDKHKPYKYHILLPNQFSHTFLRLDQNYLTSSSDKICLYAVSVGEKSCAVILDYDDNRKKEKKELCKLETNNYVIFPSTQQFFITKNTSQQINILLEIEYDVV